MDPSIPVQAKQLWQYLRLNHTLQKADLIMALGSYDLRVAEYAAQLYLDGWAPLVLMTGFLGKCTAGIWDEAEADKFAKVAVAKGVPPARILVENKSTNTGENLEFSRKLMENRGIDPAVILAVHKPYAERRIYATFEKTWPDKKVIVTSPPLSFEQYPTAEIPLEQLITIMVGDFQRILLYPRFGYQTRQTVPDTVMQAYQYLVNAGFTGHLLPEDLQLPVRQ